MRPALLGWLLAGVWTLVMALSLGWNLYVEHDAMLTQAKASAIANFNKDLAFRHWATQHGGVYVPVTPKQTPVPWLSFLPDRDVVTTDGKRLTLLNPATMLRQVMDEYTKRGGVTSRITGLVYLNPANAPDDWERARLLEFQRGLEREAMEVVDVRGRPYLRYFQAIYMERGCLKCHARQGFKLGDLRGGIGVNVPLAPYYAAYDSHALTLGLTHGSIWFLGLAGILLLTGKLTRHAEERESLLHALARSEERFDLAMRGTNDGVWDLDLEHNAVYCSPRMLEMLGVTQSDAPRDLEAWLSLVHPDDRVGAEAAIRAHLDGRQPRYESSFRIRHGYGHFLWVMCRGQAVRGDGGRSVRMVGTLTDITERKGMEDQLFAEKERAQVTLASIGDAVLTTDAEGNVSFMNAVAERLTGWTLAEARGLPAESVCVLLDEESRQPVPTPIGRCREESAAVHVSDHILLISRQGEEIAIDDSAAPILDREGRLIGVVMVFHDVTQTRELHRQMVWQINHDALTGLASRRAFERRLELLVQDAHDNGSEHALLYLDLDQFKVVNDSCGHVAGDELLKQLAFLLSEQMRKNDTLARLGGDEFGALLENCPLPKAEEIAEKLRLMVKDFRFAWEGRFFDVGVSIGVVRVGPAIASAATALTAADMACYAAKDAGRNRVRVDWTAEVDGSSRHQELGLVKDIRSALDSDRFILFAQQILPLQGAQERHYEVLLRMPDALGDLVPPARTVQAAERYGFMPEVDRRIMRQALACLAEHTGKAGDISLSINLSGLSLRDDNMLREIRQAFRDFPVDPARITFEITETAAITQLGRGLYFIRELRELGCRFSLDDFGTGMSSFNYLKNLPVDYLKIDGGFVREIAKDPVNRAFVGAINDIGHILGKRTIAEFVATEEILEMLKKMGVDYAQGYAVGKPRPLKSIVMGL
jgi:diguanylate cyclase (GGDEF)-like protein/PAS domain S-box-containing protein